MSLYDSTMGGLTMGKINEGIINISGVNTMLTIITISLGVYVLCF